MGCNQSTNAQQPLLQKVNNNNNNKTINNDDQFLKNKFNIQKYQMIMIGISKRGPLILALTSNFHIQTLKTKYNFPRYAQAIISTQNTNIGYLTGGVEQLEINVNQKASIDFQILEGIISKKLIKVNLNLLMTQPDNAFQTLTDMNNPRYAHCCIQFNNKIYVMGGRDYGGNQASILNNCQVFDIISQKWNIIPSLNQPRSEASCVIFKESIYIFGGCVGHNIRTKIIQSFSENQKIWKKLPYLMPEGLQNPALIKNKQSESIYIFGGKSDYGKSNRVFELDLNKQTVFTHIQMKQQRCSHKIAQNGDQIYLIGGGTQTIQIYNIKEQHTEVNNDINYLQFCSTKQMNSFTQFKSSIVINSKKRKYQNPDFKNKIYIFGHSHQPFSKILDCDKFIVTNDGQNLAHNFYQFTTTIKVNKQHCFVLGGINSDFTEVTDKVYSFNMLTQQIKYLEPMKSPRYGCSAIVKGSYLYVIGGRKIGGDDVAILNQCQRFSFQTYKWESIASLKTKRHSSFAVIAGQNIAIIGGYKGNGARISDVQIYIENQNRWVQLDNKFQIAIQAMTPIVFEQQIYLFGGRNQNTDIQKVFKLKIQVQQAVKYQRSINFELQPVGTLSNPGTNLKIYMKPQGLCYIFGNVDAGIDVYDLKKHKIVQKQQLVVFNKLKDRKFQSYTLIY